MKKFFYAIFIVAIFNYCSTAQEKERIANINTIFDKMESQGIDTKNQLLYGYFFFDSNKSKLEKLKDELVSEKYRFVKLELMDNQKFMLHVEKIEVHSRSSLLERETNLKKLANQFGVAEYDGWDVGNADPTKPLSTKDSFVNSLKGKSPSEIYKIAIQLYEQEIYDKAVLAFQKCIESNYKNDTCNYKLGVSYLELGDSKLGIAKLEEALRINPKYFKACYNIGATCYTIQEYEQSIKYYKIAAQLNPLDDTVLYGIAASQFVLGQFKDSKSYCLAALKLNNQNINARELLERINQK